MAQFTVHHPAAPQRQQPERSAEPVDVQDETRWQLLRQSGPLVLAVALLFGVTVGGAFVLRDVLDLGVWLLSAS